MHAEQRRARLDLVGRATFDGAAHVLGAIPPHGLSQETFEELAVLVEVFDGVGMVGAQTVHEFVEVVRQPLLGLLARAINRGDHRGVVRLASIHFVLFAPLCGGALILVNVLGLAFVLVFIEDRPDLLLTGGMVRGDVEQVTGGSGLQAAKLVDQGLVGHPGEECADDVRIEDIKKGVAPL